MANTSKNIGEKVGTFVGFILLMCATAIVVAGTYKLISWLLGW